MYVVPPPEFGSNSASDLRVYQTWKGSNVFFLQGRFIFGPDARSLGLTVLLIVAPVLIFCIFVARKLMDDFSHHLGVSVMVVAVVFTFYVLVLLLLTSGRDPGIIPRNAHPPEPEVTGGTTPEVGAGQTPQLRLPRFKEVTINGVTVKTKYCDSCMLYRPPRCSHCSICNNCVERFDHHCPWVGQCIGQRNYRFFFMFVFSTTLLCIYVFGFCWVYVKKIMVGEKTTVWKAMIKTPASIVLLSYTIIAVWFVSGLSVFHLYLISTNQTTYENFRYRYDWQDNPYNRGVVQNFMEVFCTSISPSKNKFRARVTRDPGLAKQPEVGGFVSPNMGKAVEDIEMGRKAVWNELDSGANHNEGQLVGDDGLMNVKDMLGELHPEIRTPVEDKVDGGHAGMNPRRSSWGRKSGSWEMSPEVLALAGRVGESNRAPGSSSGSMNANQHGEQ